MERIARTLTLVCLIFAAHTLPDVAHAEIPSMQALAEDAGRKASECKRAGLHNRRAGKEAKWADECTSTCSHAYSLLSRAYRTHQDKQNREMALAQMERCKQAYSVNRSPESAPVEEEITMPATIEEMAAQMLTMKSTRKLKNDPCVAGANAIQRRKIGREQARHFWDGCVRNYKSEMEMRRMFGP